MSSSEAKPRRNLFSYLFAPKSTDFRLIFREQTIRVVLPIFIVLSVLSFASSFLIYKDTSSAFPIATGVAGGVLIIAEIAILKGNIQISSILLVFVTIFFSAFIQTDPSSAPIIGSTYLTGVVLSSLILPLEAILPVAGLMLVLIVVVSLVTGGGQLDTSALTNIAIPCAAGLALLYSFRVEYEAKLLKTDQARHEADAARRDADRANQAKSHFLANMTHEFRTPLNAIIGYTDLMLMGVVGEIPEKPKELLGFVKVNAQRHLGLVNEVLDMSAIEAGKIDVHIKPENVPQLVTTTVSSLLSLAQQKQLTLKTTVDASMPTDPIRTDGKKIEQIVTNLVGNAVKFTSTGGIEVILGSSQPSDWYLKVKDTGRGMPEDAKQYIFETFRQVESADAADHQGTGLGLAITLGLVKVIGGSINVESEVGKGSTFTVTFPRNPTAGTAELVAPGTLGGIIGGKSDSHPSASAN